MKQTPKEKPRKLAVDEFHGHLDKCRQCREHPFDLCREGQRLIRRVGR